MNPKFESHVRDDFTGSDRIAQARNAVPLERALLPEPLERRVEIVVLPKKERQCSECGSDLREIGEDVTEELEIIPMQVFVRRIVRKKKRQPL